MGSLLEARSVSKRYPGVHALNRVDVEVRPAEVHILLGENGAGKSTLVKLFAGADQPDEGQIHVDGIEVDQWDTRSALQAGVSTIYQELNLVPDMSVMENIYLGNEPTRRLFIRDVAELRASTLRLLKEFDLAISPEARVSTLGIAHQQLVEILKALSTGKERILILDEPTAVLSEHEVDQLFAIIEQLRQRGVGMLYVTHRLEEVPRIGDVVTVMRDGAVVGHERAANLDRAQIIEWMVGSPVDDHPRTRHSRPSEQIAALEVHQLTRIGEFENVSITVNRGEIVSLFGLVGAGRTAVARCIIGAETPDGGLIRIGGESVVNSSPTAAIGHGVGMAPEDRKKDGIIPLRSVRENVVLGALKRLTRRFKPLLDRVRAVRTAEALVKRLRVRTPSLETPLGLLSGGNQQKVILARLLATDVQVAILDEPTRGIDVGARQGLYELIEELANEGKAILVISSDIDEVLKLSDRILVMSSGRIEGELIGHEADRRTAMNLAFSSGESTSASSPAPTERGREQPSE